TGTTSTSDHYHSIAPAMPSDVITGTGSWGWQMFSDTVMTETVSHYHVLDEHTHALGSQTPSTTASVTRNNPPFVTVNYIIKYDAAAADPCGAIWGNVASGPAAGAVVANGTALNRTTYSTLYACLGTTYGAGDGSTTFNPPCLEQCTATSERT